MSRVQGVIWDMDGVIVDSEPLHERAFLEVFRAIGYGETHGIRFSEYYGRSDRILWLDFMATHQPPYPMETLAEWKQAQFLEMLRREEPIFKGLPELVGRLGRFYRQAVASGSSHAVIREVLALRDLRSAFSAVVSAQDVSHGKPSPEIFLKASTDMGVEPARCCVIEDSEAGVEAAVAAGMPVVAITHTFPANRLHRADHVVSDLTEVGRLLVPNSFSEL